MSGCSMRGYLHFVLAHCSLRLKILEIECSKFMSAEPNALEAAFSGAKAETYLQTNDEEAQRFFHLLRANSIHGPSPASEHMCPMPEWAWRNATGILLNHNCALNEIDFNCLNSSRKKLPTK